MKRGLSIFIVALLLIIILTASLIFLFNYEPYLENTPKMTFNDNTVISVIDGDTFKLYSGETIRLLCVNTPEKNQDGYEEAKSFLESLILNKEVILTPTSSEGAPDKDIYGRYLRYVYINDNQTLVNKEILNQDFGESLIIPPEGCEEIIR